MDWEGQQKEEEPIWEELGTSRRKKGESREGWGTSILAEGRACLERWDSGLLEELKESSAAD